MLLGRCFLKKIVMDFETSGIGFPCIDIAYIALGRSWVTSGHVFYVGLGPLDLTRRGRKARPAGRPSWRSYLTSDATGQVFVVSQIQGWRPKGRHIQLLLTS